jgi:hypothetical protein
VNGEVVSGEWRGEVLLFQQVGYQPTLPHCRSGAAELFCIFLRRQPKASPREAATGSAACSFSPLLVGEKVIP